MIGKFIETVREGKEVTDDSMNQYDKRPVIHHKFYEVLDKVRVSKLETTGCTPQVRRTVARSYDCYLCEDNEGGIWRILPERVHAVHEERQEDKKVIKRK